MFYELLLFGQEFLYPVEQLDENNILLMHQTSVDNIELLIWNKNNKIVIKELTSLYLPSNVKILPSKQAYSFVDRGRLRIKSFTKRTPKTINFSAPLCDIQSLCWINDDQCFFVAKYRNFYKVFLYDQEKNGGTLYYITNLQDDVNYTFPNKVNDTLYCIAQTSDGVFQLITLPWQPQVFQDHTNYRQPYITTEYFIGNKLVHDKPLCFLQMIDQEHGFVLEMLEKVPDQAYFEFECCFIQCIQSKWSIQNIFSIVLPEKLIIGQGSCRLYESIYPLLPRYYDRKIYFTNYDVVTEKCQIGCYDLHDANIEENIIMRGIADNYEHLFAPLLTSNDQLFAGYSHYNQEYRKYRSALHVNEINGVLDCDVPIIN